MGKNSAASVFLVVLVACGSYPGESADSLMDRRTVVVLTFDDGRADQLEAVQILDKFGMRGTFFLVSSQIGKRDQLTMAQAIALRVAGHEIGGHTLHHVHLPELSDEEATREVCDDREALTRAGLGAILSFSFPFSDSDRRTAAIVAHCGYHWGRSQGGIDRTSCLRDCVYAESFVPGNPFQIQAPASVKSDWTLADLQGFVLRAEGDGGVIIFTIHHVCETCDEFYRIKPSLLREFAAWLADRRELGTVVLPLGEAFAGGEPERSRPDVIEATP